MSLNVSFFFLKNTEAVSRNFLLFLLLPEDTHTHTHPTSFSALLLDFLTKLWFPNPVLNPGDPRSWVALPERFSFSTLSYRSWFLGNQTFNKHQTPNTKHSASTYIQALGPQPSPPSTCSCWGWELLWKQTNIPSSSPGAPLLPGNQSTVPAKGSLLWTSLMPLAFLNREY